MNNSIYAAVLGSRIEAFRLDVTANNLANATTPGFKSEAALFQTHLDYISKKEFDSNRNALDNAGKYLSTAGRFSPGPMQQSGREFDLAIDGDGFFAVQTPKGEGYTRAGNFQLDTEGNLITPTGYPVLGEGGPITVDTSKDFIVSEDGTVFSGGAQVDRLRLVDVADKAGLQRVGSNIFTSRSGAAAESEESKVIQGALEGSNVNVMREMGTMVTAGRNFEAYARVISLVNDINSRSATSLGTM